MSGKRKSGIRRVGRGLVAGAMVAFVTGVLPWSPVPTASAANEDANLEVSPEAAGTNGPGEPYTLTAQLVNELLQADPAEANSSVVVDFEVEEDGDGKSLGSPDASCTINATQSTCTVSVNSSTAGTKLVWAWIDDDVNGPVIEADTAEGRLADPFRDCGQEPSDACAGQGDPGAVGELDRTDVIELTWAGTPAKLDCDGKQSGVDQQAAKPAADATIVCKVTDQNGNPREGVLVDAENLAGANDPDNLAASDAEDNPDPDYETHSGKPGPPPEPPADFCETGGNGTCEATIEGSEAQLGPANICLWMDDDGDSVYDNGGSPNDGGECNEEGVGEAEANDATDTLTVSWEDPDPAKGGVDGQVESAAKDPGQQHSITATVFSQFGEKFAGNTTVKFEFFSGSPNDADGNTPNTPDRTCSTAGKDNCTITYSQADPGTDLVCVFTNANPAMAGDSKNGTCDGEGLLDASANDGAPSPPNDDQDVVRRIWNGGVEDQGYWMVASDGGIFSFGNGAKFHGSTGDIALAKPIVGMAALFTGTGYWLVASDGGVFSFGDAKFHGSTGDITLAQPIVGMAPTPSGNGYWLVASDGGIFAFGDAKFHGSTGNIQLAQPVVGMAATPTGNGYWLVAKDGGIFAFGDAKFHGSTGDIVLAQPVVGMAATPSGNGYWFVAADGGIFSFGDAAFHGSTGDIVLAKPVVGMAVTPSGNGYWFTASDGGIFAFGDAGFFGSTGNIVLAQPVVGMAAAPAQ